MLHTFYSTPTCLQLTLLQVCPQCLNSGVLNISPEVLLGIKHAHPVLPQYFKINIKAVFLTSALYIFSFCSDLHCKWLSWSFQKVSCLLEVMMLLMNRLVNTRQHLFFPYQFIFSHSLWISQNTPQFCSVVCFVTNFPFSPFVSSSNPFFFFATVGVCSSWQCSIVCLMWFPEVLNCSPWPLFLSSVDLLSL